MFNISLLFLGGGKVRVKLKTIRVNNNLTQQEVAEVLGISRAYYGMIENGKRNPTLKLANNIANFFNEDIQKLFF